MPGRGPRGRVAVTPPDVFHNQTWDDVADWYAAKLAAGSPIHEWALVVLLAETGAPQGEPVLDLGCGEGLVARGLAERGAEVTGVDGSERMLANARRQETAQPLGIDYRQLDARVLDGLPGERFAGVTANLSLNDIPDLDAVLTAVHRVLRPGGWFVFSVPHPCFETPHASWGVTSDGVAGRLVNAYFDERFWRSSDPEGVRRVGNYHRTLATLLNALIGHGFDLVRVAEPRPAAAVVDLQPGRAQVPLLLVVRADKPSA